MLSMQAFIEPSAFWLLQLQRPDQIRLQKHRNFLSGAQHYPMGCRMSREHGKTETQADGAEAAGLPQSTINPAELPEFEYTPLSGPREFRLLTLRPRKLWNNGIIVAEIYNQDFDSIKEWSASCMREALYRSKVQECKDAGVKFDQEALSALKLDEVVDNTSAMVSDGQTLPDTPYFMVPLKDKQFCHVYRHWNALSYTWGSGSKSKTMILNGARFQITENLNSALRDLARDDTAQLYWVDALCINQNDIPERNQSVQMMGEIYAAASSVSIYLGESTSETEDCLSYVRAVGDFMSQAPGFGSSLFASDKGAEYFQRIRKEVFDRSWWQRAWVVQEAALAVDPVVQIGSRQACTLTGLLAVASTAPWGVSASGGPESDDHLGLDAARFMQSCRSFRPKLRFLIGMSRGVEATDPRDKIFALRGLTCDVDDDVLVPDYFKSKQDVFYEVAEFYLNKYDSLDFLFYVAHLEDEQDDGLPSWVPDFGRSVKGLAAVSPSEVATYTYKTDAVVEETVGSSTRIWTDRDMKIFVPKAGGAYSPDVKIHDSKILETDAVFIATLEHFGRRKRHRKFFEDFLSTSDKRTRKSGQKEIDPSPKIEGDAPLKFTPWQVRGGQYSDTPLLGFGFNDPNAKAFDENSAYVQTVEEAVARTWLGDADESMERLHPMMGFIYWRGLHEGPEPLIPSSFLRHLDFYQRAAAFPVHMANSNKRVSTQKIPFATGEEFGTGFIGWAPATAQKGDVVCIIKGCSFPCILRKVAGTAVELDEIDTYRFVGTAYCHGIMDGEAMRDHEENEKYKSVKVRIV